MCIIPEYFTVSKCCGCLPLRKGSIMYAILCILLYILHAAYLIAFDIDISSQKMQVFTIITIVVIVSDIAIIITCCVIFWYFLNKKNMDAAIVLWEMIILAHYLALIFHVVGLFLLSKSNYYELIMVMADTFISSYFTIVLVSYTPIAASDIKNTGYPQRVQAIRGESDERA